MTTLVLAALVTSPTAAPAVKATKTLVGVRVIALAAAPTGNKVAASMEDGTIRIYDASTRMVLKTLTGHPQPVRALAWSKDGKLLASGDDSARIFIWATSNWTKKNEIRPHTRAIQALDFNAAGTQLLSTGNDDRVLLFNLNSMKKPVLELPGNGANFYSAKFGPNSTIGVATLTNGARTYTMKGAQKQVYVAHDFQGCLDGDFNKSGTRMVSAGKDSRVAMFDMKDAKRLGYFKGHQDWVTQARFTPDGKWLMTSSADRTFKLWNIYNFQPVFTIDDCSMVGTQFCITGSGKYILTTDTSDNLRVHELTVALAAAASKKK